MDTVSKISDDADFLNNITPEMVEDSISDTSSYSDIPTNMYIFSMHFDLVFNYDITSFAYISIEEIKKKEKMVLKKINYSFSAMPHSLKLIECSMSRPYKENRLISKYFGKSFSILFRIGIIFSGCIYNIRELEYFIRGAFPKFDNVYYTQCVIKSHYTNNTITFNINNIMKFLNRQCKWYADCDEISVYIYKLFNLLKNYSTEQIDIKDIFNRYCKKSIFESNETMSITIKHQDLKSVLCLMPPIY